MPCRHMDNGNDMSSMPMAQGQKQEHNDNGITTKIRV